MKLEQENEAEINQASAAVCEGYAVVCDNTAVNFANVDQDNDAIQANANNQGQNGGSAPRRCDNNLYLKTPTVVTHKKQN